MNKYLMFSILILSLVAVSCGGGNKKKIKTPKVEQVNYPAVLWKKNIGNPFVIVGESKRRLFILNKDEEGNITSIEAVDKNTGRKKWSENVEIAMKDPSVPWSYEVAFKGITIAFRNKNDEIKGIDKYRGTATWDKPVKGSGLSVLGENFITFYKSKIILIDPDTGKTITFDMGREINDLAVTPKGYVLVLTGEVLNLVDLENEKINKKWVKHLNLDGGFMPGTMLATDNSVIMFQHTAAVEHHTIVENYDLTSARKIWNMVLRGKVKGPKAFVRYNDADILKLVVIPEVKGEKQWVDLDLSKGVKKNIFLSYDYPDKNCIFARKTTYCMSDKGVTAYDKNMKKLWFRETIYPVNEGGHKVIKDNIVLAAGTRVKVFSPKGDTAFVYDIKSKNLKEPRAGRILGSFGGKLIFTVVDYEKSKKGEIWAVDGRTKQLAWKVPVGSISDVANRVFYSPENSAVFAVNSRFILKTDLMTGKTRKRRHKQKLTSKSGIKIGVRKGFLYVAFPEKLELYSLKNLRVQNTFGYKRRLKTPKNTKNSKKKQKSPLLKFGFFGITDTAVILITGEGKEKTLVAYDIEKSKELWHKNFSVNSSFPVSVEIAGNNVFVNSFDNNFIFDARTGKISVKLPKITKFWNINNHITLVYRTETNPSKQKRIIAYPYENPGVKPLWTKVFKAGDKELPSWISVGPEYIFLPSDNSKCLSILADTDGSSILNFCKGIWHNPPLTYKEQYYFTTGALTDKVPYSQQGLLQFNLNGKWKQVLKPGKYGDPKYMNAQYHKIRKGIIYISSNGHILQAVAVTAP